MGKSLLVRLYLDLLLGVSIKRGLLMGLIIVWDDTEHSLVVQEHLWRQSLNDPFVLKGFKRGHPLARIPGETSF